MNLFGGFQRLGFDSSEKDFGVSNARMTGEQ